MLFKEIIADSCKNRMEVTVAKRGFTTHQVTFTVTAKLPTVKENVKWTELKSLHSVVFRAKFCSK